MDNHLRIIALAAVLLSADIGVAQTPSPVSDPFNFTADGSTYDQPPEISPNAERWRYSFQNGFWWHFTPERRWLYWSQGHWVEYLPLGRSNSPPYIQPPAMQRPFRRRWLGPPANAYPYSSAVPSYGNGFPYLGQPGLGVY